MLDVVKKEFKDHVGEMENMRNAVREKHVHSSRWTAFEDDENSHPNLFATQTKQTQLSSVIDGNKPFFHDNQDHQNPFWSPKQGLFR